MSILADASKIAKGVFAECLEQLDAAEHPDPLPYSLILRDAAKRNDLIQIGIEKYIDGIGTMATPILGAKGQYSFRKFARLTPSTLLAYELFAREFALQAQESWSDVALSFKFDKNLPRRLYQERKPSDRHRWKNFITRRNSNLKSCVAIGEKGDLYCMEADLARFFDYIRFDRLESEMLRWFPKEDGRIRKFIEFITVVSGDSSGLPAGPQCSFFFADILLLHYDKIAASKINTTLRWVDEIWWFHKYPSAIEGRFRALLQEYSRLGLNFNDKKHGFVNPAEILAETEAFDRIREVYYGKMPSSAAGKIAYLCGLIIERADRRSPASYSDKFLINRIRQLFSEELEDAKQAAPLVVEAFKRSYDRSPDSLNVWHAVLKSLPDKEMVAKVAYEAIRDHRYPMEVDKARLIELITSYDTIDYYEKIMPTAKLKRIASNVDHCPTMRGNALRAYCCRTLSHDHAIELAIGESQNRELRQYIAASALCLRLSSCERILDTLISKPIDEEEKVILEGYRELMPAPKDNPTKNPDKFLLPSNLKVVKADLERSVRDSY